MSSTAPSCKLNLYKRMLTIFTRNLVTANRLWRSRIDLHQKFNRIDPKLNSNNKDSKNVLPNCIDLYCWIFLHFSKQTFRNYFVVIDRDDLFFGTNTSACYFKNFKSTRTSTPDQQLPNCIIIRFWSTISRRHLFTIFPNESNIWQTLVQSVS